MGEIDYGEIQQVLDDLLGQNRGRSAMSIRRDM